MLSLILLLLFVFAEAAFDAAGKNNFVVYWGQASAGSQQSLGSYCELNQVDMVVLAFMTIFPGSSGVPLMNLGNTPLTLFSNGLLHYPTMAADIKTCQSKGIKVLLSLGGASGSYGFTTDSEATEFAETLWNYFGEGSSDTRPFDDAVLDGFDLDIENNNMAGYAALARGLRLYFAKGTKPFYISAAP